MKVVIASDSYKNCMSSLQAANAIECGIHRYNTNIEVLKYAIADGGEGTLDAIAYNLDTQRILLQAKNAAGKSVETYYEYYPKEHTAFIEVAQIIGVKKQSEGVRAPMYYSSYGVGQVMLHAKRKGAKKIIIGLGGSATNDGGFGLLSACGVKFYDENNSKLVPKAKDLCKIVKIDKDNFESFKGIDIVVACDVKNKLLGEQGATYTFGRQKGLFPNQLKIVERGMVHYSTVVKNLFHIDLTTYEGGGAAGGIGACLQGFFQAKMVSGLELVLSYTDFEKQIKDADLVITGEGQSDHQTLFGKVPVGIIDCTNMYKIPTLIISGALGYEYMDLYEKGFIGIYSIADRVMTFEQALSTAPQKLEQCAYSVISTISYFYQKNQM